MVGYVSCVICGKEYHACNACGLEDWEYEYCSWECATKSDEYKRIEAFVGTLTDEQKKELDDINEGSMLWEYVVIGKI